MLDLKNMSDEEFTILVTSSVPQDAMYVKIDESGNISLSRKVAEKLSKTPVHIYFNQDYTAIQISKAPVEEKENCITFPKSGRKSGLNAADMLKEKHIPLPAIFRGYFCDTSNKWRGERQQNPTSKPSPTIRRTRKN